MDSRVKYLLHVSIGPVQSFIASARKTRDLRAGSQLLQDVVRAAVKEIGKSPGAMMIFPPQSEDESDAANVITAIVGDPSSVAFRARKAALGALQDKWSRTQEFLLGKKLQTAEHFDFGLAERQIESFLEFYAGWAPYEGEDYSEARRLAASRLASSKALRSFESAPAGEDPGSKSSLDPSFESVIRAKKDGGWRLPEPVCKRLLLNSYETLDAISLTKRFYFGDGSRRYPTFASTRTVAVQDLLDNAKNSAELAELDQVIRELNAIGDLDYGTIVFDVKDDIRRVLMAHGMDYSRELENRIKRAREAFLKTFNDGAAPRRYFAVIVADGDGMGRFLDSLETPEEHQMFSRNLGAFSRKCGPIVERRSGTHIYAGGDDVLALCPVKTALDLASDLHGEFAEAMSAYAEGVRPTLSVAVAICPISADLQECVQFAHSLEKRKKEVGKDALIFAIRVRGGSDRGIIASWKDAPVVKIQGILRAFDEEETLPRGFASDVTDLAISLSAIPDIDPKHVGSEFGRLWEHKEPVNRASAPPEEVSIGESPTPLDLAYLGELLTVAHILSRTGDEV